MSTSGASNSSIKESETAFWVYQGFRRAIKLDVVSSEYFSQTELKLIEYILQHVHDHSPKNQDKDNLLVLSDAEQRKHFYRLLLGYDEFVSLRKIMINECILKAKEKGIKQVVFLGAGYDVRSLFIPKELSVFELDRGLTRERKIDALKDLPKEWLKGYSYKETDSAFYINDNIKLIQCDFLSDNLAECLTSHGFDKERETLFIAEGVTVYLTGEAVSKLLNNVHSLMGEKSEFLLSFMPGNPATKELGDELKKSAEEYRFSLPPSNVIVYAREHDFSATARFTTNSSGKFLSEQVVRFYPKPEFTPEPYYVFEKGKNRQKIFNISDMPEIDLEKFKPLFLVEKIATSYCPLRDSRDKEEELDMDKNNKTAGEVNKNEVEQKKILERISPNS